MQPGCPRQLSESGRSRERKTGLAGNGRGATDPGLWVATGHQAPLCPMPCLPTTRPGSLCSRPETGLQGRQLCPLSNLSTSRKIRPPLSTAGRPCPVAFSFPMSPQVPRSPGPQVPSLCCFSSITSTLGPRASRPEQCWEGPKREGALPSSSAGSAKSCLGGQ